MSTKKIHYISGLIITIFVGLHLSNHCFSILGPGKHIEVMATLRLFYRSIFIETILFLAIAAQIYSGLKLFGTKSKTVKTLFDKLQIWTGLYLAIFFIIHLCAILLGRYILNLDTNFYFGAAGLNSFPTNLFFIPYYTLAIISFFGHISAIHSVKIQQNILGLTPFRQSQAIFMFGIALAFIILYGFTNHFHGVQIPSEYNILIGK